MINKYDKGINDKVVDIAIAKLDEITTLIIKKDIVPENVELNSLIKIEKNKNDEILYMDIDMDYTRKLMVETVGKIQSNIFKLEQGNIDYYINNNEIKRKNKNLYIEVPLQMYRKGVLLNGLGPKIPIKISFYEHVLGNIDIVAEEYGINNALIKVYLSIELEQKIILPYKEEKIHRRYDLLLGSKVIQGKVPNIYGGNYKKSSDILEF